MKQDIINNISNLAQDACYKESNMFGENIWTYHMIPVVNHSRTLAQKFNIDVECALIAAYLHDYASVLNKSFYKEHHIHGARIAEEILIHENYPSEKIEIVKRCIINHRGSIENNDSSLETICLASADAMAHITEVPSLLYLAYHIKNIKVSERSQWVLKKINKSWSKLCPEAQAMVQDIYIANTTVLSKNTI